MIYSFCLCLVSQIRHVQITVVVNRSVLLTNDGLSSTETVQFNVSQPEHKLHEISSNIRFTNEDNVLFNNDGKTQKATWSHFWRTDYF